MPPPIDFVTSTPVIRVLIADLQGVLGQVVAEVLRGQADIRLVGHVHGRVKLLLATRAGVDIVVLGAKEPYPAPGICSHLLSEFPDLKILVLATSGSSAMLYWLGIRRRRLVKVSENTLLNQIRWAAVLNPTV